MSTSPTYLTKYLDPIKDIIHNEKINAAIDLNKENFKTLSEKTKAMYQSTVSHIKEDVPEYVKSISEKTRSVCQETTNHIKEGVSEMPEYLKNISEKTKDVYQRSADHIKEEVSGLPKLVRTKSAEMRDLTVAYYNDKSKLLNEKFASTSDYVKSKSSELADTTSTYYDSYKNNISALDIDYGKLWKTYETYSPAILMTAAYVSENVVPLPIEGLTYAITTAAFLRKLYQRRQQYVDDYNELSKAISRLRSSVNKFQETVDNHN